MHETDSEAPYECAVSADLMRRAMMCVSDEQTRYYLQGVRVEPNSHGGATLVATNGHYMIVLRDPSGYVSEGGVLVKPNAALIKAFSARRPTYYKYTERAAHLFLARGDKAAVAWANRDSFFNPIDYVDAPTQSVTAYQWFDARINGTFPDWRRVVPQEWRYDKPVPEFDHRKMTVLATALTRIGKRQTTPVRFAASGGENDPIVVVPEMSGIGAVEGFGVIMPVRSSVRTPARPEWSKA